MGQLAIEAAPKREPLVCYQGKPRTLHYATPDFLSMSVAPIMSMRLSLMKAAHAVLSSEAKQEIRVRSGPNDTAGAADRFSAAPTALGSSSGIDFPALPGWADVWLSALRALHLQRSLPCHFSLDLPQASQLLAMTFPRKVRGTADSSTARRDRSASSDFLSRVAASVDCMWFFKENHISGTGESGEVGNPGTLGMTKERATVP